DFIMEIVNAKGFSFTPGSAMFAVIPYDAALADLRMVLPRGSTASVEGAVVPLEDTGTMHVTLAGADGSTEYYTVHLRREPAPGIDLNCRLSRLEVEGFRLDPAFDPDVTDYTVKVPYGTERINVYCVQQNKTATVNVGDTSVRGDKTVISVSVVSRDGEELVYRITVERLPPEESKPQTNESQWNEEPPLSPRKSSWPAVAIAAAAAAAAGTAALVYYRRKMKKNKNEA
ncbi:MAG: cadherin-like beta sandwich domain-containing protein, partial [Clostridia bacterium]|nr:cadherin-like beta sandwich domain-containing protein [Clostridia bacterium]